MHLVGKFFINDMQMLVFHFRDDLIFLLRNSLSCGLLSGASSSLSSAMSCISGFILGRLLRLGSHLAFHKFSDLLGHTFLIGLIQMLP